MPNRGGRPRLPTLAELKEQQAALNIQNKRNGGWLPNGLKDLKELFNAKSKVGGS